MITRTVTIKEDENGPFVLFLPLYHNKCEGNIKGRFVIRMPDKPNSFSSHDAEPLKVGEKVQVQEFNSNMGWYKVRRKGSGQYSLWNGPRLERNGFTVCWVPQ